MKSRNLSKYPEPVAKVFERHFTDVTSMNIARVGLSSRTETATRYASHARRYCRAPFSSRAQRPWNSEFNRESVSNGVCFRLRSLLSLVTLTLATLAESKSTLAPNSTESQARTYWASCSGFEAVWPSPHTSRNSSNASSPLGRRKSFLDGRVVMRYLSNLISASLGEISLPQLKRTATTSGDSRSSSIDRRLRRWAYLNFAFTKKGEVTCGFSSLVWLTVDRRLSGVSRPI